MFAWIKKVFERSSQRQDADQLPFNRADLPPRRQDAAEVPYPGEIEEAKKWPNGQVYRIKGNFGAEEFVPPQAIVGAWKVDSEGKIIGDFMRNPNFDPKFEKG